jgi:hypothetical protein
MAEVSAQKLSSALDEQVAHAAGRAAEASRNALAIEDGLIAVAEWEAECGPLSSPDLRAADAALADMRGSYPAA